MEKKRTSPELVRAMMELLGCPCTYFVPMWDDDPLLECLQTNLEPEGEVRGVTPEQVAVRYWQEWHGVVPCAVTHGALECQLSRPMVREESIALTLGQQGFCLDIVDQGVGQIGILTDGLVKSELWYFWWN